MLFIVEMILNITITTAVDSSFLYRIAAESSLNVDRRSHAPISMRFVVLLISSVSKTLDARLNGA